MDIHFEKEVIYQVLAASSKHDSLVTLPQIQGLASLVNQALVNKKRVMRIAVMDWLIGDLVNQLWGIRFSTFKNMSGQMASYLIELFKNESTWEVSDYGRKLIQGIEKEIKNSALSNADRSGK